MIKVLMMIPHYAECKQKQEKTHETLFDGRVSCIHCNRFFLPERVGKHQEICEILCKKQLFFDRKRSPKNSESLTRVKTNIQHKYANSKWQKQHQDMIKKLRFDDCTEEYDDYIQCPHCLRRFASIPAEKHIPICKNIIHKPKALSSRINLLPKLSEKSPPTFRESFKDVFHKPTPLNSSVLCNITKSDTDGGNTERVRENNRSIDEFGKIVHTKKPREKRLTEPRSKSIYRISTIVCRCGELMPDRAIYCMMCGNCRYR